MRFFLIVILNSHDIFSVPIWNVSQRKRKVFFMQKVLPVFSLNLFFSWIRVLNCLSSFMFIFWSTNWKLFNAGSEIGSRICWTRGYCFWKGSRWTRCWVLGDLRGGWLAGCNWYGCGTDCQWCSWACEKKFVWQKELWCADERGVRKLEKAKLVQIDGESA